jgi:CubicO group peptidase (beta-lactamase class C family)
MWGGVVFASNAPESNDLDNSCITANNSSVHRGNIENQLLSQIRFSNGELPAFTLQERMNTIIVPAASVTVIKNNTIDWSNAYGVLASDSDEKADCGTLFQSASLSKPVMMMAVLRMAEQKALKLDENIESYLSSFTLPEGKQSKENPVTFRNILRHTSGITAGGFMGYTQSEAMPTDIEVLKAASNVNSNILEVVDEPGKQLMYSGVAYTLAEVALQDIFKKSFADIMSEWVLSPTGMTLSDFAQPLDVKKYDSIARAHNSTGAVIDGGWHNHPEQAAAGLWSTSQELAQFLIEIGKGYRGESEVFSKATIDELLTDPISQHAYGFRMMGEGDSLALVHYGRNVGYVTGMVLNLVSGDGAVVLTNSDNGFNLMNELFLTISNEYQWPHYKQNVMEKKSLPIDTLNRFVGQYKFEAQGWSIAVEFDPDSKQLVLAFPNNDRYSLVPTTQEEYHLVHPETGVQTRFEMTDKGTVLHLYGQVGAKQ